MKNLTIILLACLTLLTSCFTTKLIPVSFPEPIVKIYDVNGTKDELFINANRWMISTFKDARSIIQYSDKTEGILIGKYLLFYKPAVPPSAYIGEIPEVTIYAIIELTVKDNKARISISPDSWNDRQYNDGYSEPESMYSKEKAISDINNLCESFNKGVQAEKVEF
jgi:hypothetical protein